MAVKDVFKVYLYPDPLSGSGISPHPFEEGEDITSGIVNVDIIQGTDTYEGPQEQIDTGQFTIVTRNPDMDPKINTNLKYNSRIQFWDERSGEFFRGYVTDIQVQYQRNDDPIITITGTDIFGAMQRVVIDQDTHDAIMALSTGPTWNGITFTEFIPYMSDFSSKYLDVGVDYIGPPGYPTPQGFWFESTQSFGDLSLENLAYSPAKYIPQVGETYLDVINKYAQTNLISLSAKSNFGGPMSYNYINVSNFPKYDPNYWGPQQDPYSSYTDYDFSSDPEDGKPYETILIDNGYNRVINQVEISNEYRFVDAGELKSESENFTRTSEDSIENYAISTASISTIYPLDATLPNEDWASNYSQNIFQITQFPGQEIQQITFDNARYEDVQNDFTYSDYPLNRIIRIKHKINNDETIDKIYNIAGITHSIAPDKWEMGFTLKPSKEEVVFQYQGAFPTLEMNETTGDANFNFTATLVDYDPETVVDVVWALSATDANQITEIWPYAISGNMFKNGLPRTGLTQTWNFDDDGILAPYSFDSDSTFTEPTDNRYGGYGPGNWYVYAFVLLSSGFTVVLQQQLTVGTPEVEADFGWTQNLTNNFGQVSFTDTSVNHEIGEPDSYLWTFGDGTTSTLRNPIKVYDPAPTQTTYTVSLKVFAYGPGGTKVYNTKTETITLVQPTMTPNFTSSVNGSVVTFTNTSTNVGFEEPDAYLWDFGDGSFSIQKNPVKTYAGQPSSSTTYTVTLITRNIWEQTASVTKTVTVAPLYNTGSLPVSQLKLVKTLTVWSRTPIFSFLRGIRSDGTNLLFNKNTAITPNNPDHLWWSQLGTPVPTPSTYLTKDPSTSGGAYGFQFRENSAGGHTSWSLNTTADNSQNILTVRMNLDDKYPAGAEPWGRYYVTAPDSFGGDFAIGYFEPPAIPNFAPRQTFGRTYTMTPIRPMPPNIPYFKYTFNNTTVSFTSMETADSYAWNFGDGTTSTLKDPVKTYASKGTYTVTLAVTNNGIVTRTTTEPVIVESLAPYPIRYIKFKQKDYTGLNAWDTPFISNLRVTFNENRTVQTVPLAQYYNEQNASIAKANTYSMEWYGGTTSPGPTAPNLIDPLSPTLQNNRRLYSGGGIRTKSLDATFRSEWELVGDLGDIPSFLPPLPTLTMSNITKFTANFSRWSNKDGTPDPVCTGISYELYITDYVGDPSGISSATWTKLGDFNPTSMPLNVEKEYTMVPL